jgi:hypothetical protein
MKEQINARGEVLPFSWPRTLPHEILVNRHTNALVLFVASLSLAI